MLWAQQTKKGLQQGWKQQTSICLQVIHFTSLFLSNHNSNFMHNVRHGRGAAHSLMQSGQLCDTWWCYIISYPTSDGCSTKIATNGLPPPPPFDVKPPGHYFKTKSLIWSFYFNLFFYPTKLEILYVLRIWWVPFKTPPPPNLVPLLCVSGGPASPFSQLLAYLSYSYYYSLSPPPPPQKKNNNKKRRVMEWWLMDRLARALLLLVFL